MIRLFFIHEFLTGLMDDSYWLAFKEKNKDNWHFDPSEKVQDFTYLGRLKTDFGPLIDLMKNDTTFFIWIGDILN